LAQPLKQDAEMASTEDGIQIDFSDEHPTHADSPRIEILQPTSNARKERLVQLEKKDAETV
jgi:hypothetical protein